MLVDTPTTAIALIVSGQRTVRGPVYSVLLVLGVVPSRVRKTCPLCGTAIATWCGELKEVPLGTLKTGSRGADDAARQIASAKTSSRALHGAPMFLRKRCRFTFFAASTLKSFRIRIIAAPPFGANEFGKRRLTCAISRDECRELVISVVTVD